MSTGASGNPTAAKNMGRRVALERPMVLVAVVALSVVFGIADEALTRASPGIVSQAANSPLTWGLWSVLTGFVIGRWRLGLVAGSISTPIALAAFFWAHYSGTAAAGNAVLAWLPVGVATGLAGGAIGVACRTVTSRLARR